MPELKSTDDDIHTYMYSVDELANAIALTLQFAQRNPNLIAEITSCKDRGEAIARTFDDASDCDEAWDLDDILHGMKRTCG